RRTTAPTATATATRSETPARTRPSAAATTARTAAAAATRRARSARTRPSATATTARTATASNRGKSSCSDGCAAARQPGRAAPPLESSDVNGVAQRQLGRLVHHFAQGRVRMNRARDLFGGGLELERDAGLGEQLGRVRADDVHAEHLVVLLL